MYKSLFLLTAASLLSVDPRVFESIKAKPSKTYGPGRHTLNTFHQKLQSGMSRKYKANGKRECMRRIHQIENGRLRIENGVRY